MSLALSEKCSTAVSMNRPYSSAIFPYFGRTSAKQRHISPLISITPLQQIGLSTMLKQAYSSISRVQPCRQHTLRQEGDCTRITASTLVTTWFFMSSSTTLWKSADCYIRAEILSRLSGRFLSAKERRKLDAGLLTLLGVVDAKPAQKLYRYRKVPDRRGRI